MSNLPYYYEETPEATEFKRLYNKLHTHLERTRAKLIMVTSATVGEGKSTVAAYLAATSARFRQTETLLIDCDLRRPTVHNTYSLSLEKGVADILENKLDIRAAMKPSVFGNMKVITAGIARQSPAELFSSNRLHELFDQARFYFKCVIIDAPPIVPVSDSLLLSNEADGLLFVFKAGKTQKSVAQRALDLLQDNRKKVLGAVLNNAKGVLPYYYDYSYYDYKYYGDEFVAR
jgi:capsular exopolysaccharide synthesis family protein